MSRSAFLPILFVFLLPLAACDAPSGQGENKSPADSAANSPISRSQTPAPEPEGASTDFLLKKYQAGVDFYAIGSEPDWNLEMDFEGDFRFNTIAETGEMYTPSVEPVLAQDANIKRYRIEVEAGEMIIQVAETPCNNTMSGEAFPYRVTVDIKRGPIRITPPSKVAGVMCRIFD